MCLKMVSYHLASNVNLFFPCTQSTISIKIIVFIFIPFFYFSLSLSPSLSLTHTNTHRTNAYSQSLSIYPSLSVFPCVYSSFFTVLSFPSFSVWFCFLSLSLYQSLYLSLSLSLCPCLSVCLVVLIFPICISKV